MILISLAAGVVGIALSLMRLFIAKEIRGHRKNNQIFKMQRTPIYIMFILAVCMGLVSLSILFVQPQFRLQPSDASAPAFIGLCAVLCAMIWTLYEVRLEHDSICLGLRATKRVSYSDISKIVDIRNQGSPRSELIMTGGGAH